MDTDKQQSGGTRSTSSPLSRGIRDTGEHVPPAGRFRDAVELVPPDDTGRKRPTRGVLISPSQPTIVFLTVCTEKREPWLAQKVVQDSLEQVWREADTWLV